MKKLFFLLVSLLYFQSSYATIHIIGVWSGYYQFIGIGTVQLGDTIQWRPVFDLPDPLDPHTITSTTIPLGATPFDEPFASPVDTFFQYIPQFTGTYNYECTPHAASMGMTGSFEVVDGTAGIDGEISLILKIFPNPTTYFINIEFNNDHYTDLYMSLTNISGQRIFIQKIFAKNEIMNVSTFPKGIYFINILGLNISISKKVIIH